MQVGLINYKSTCKEFLPSFCLLEPILLLDDVLEVIRAPFYDCSRISNMLV